MIKKLHLILYVLLLFSGSNLAVAQCTVGSTMDYNGIIYTITSTNPATVAVGLNPTVSGNITLPETVSNACGSYTVTAIGNNAFRNNTSITSVAIPNTVTSIGTSAFRDCITLASVSIPNSVTNIGSVAFFHCSALTSVTLPNSLTSINDNVFRECSALSSINIPNGVTSIGYAAFSDCLNLSSVTLPSSVTSFADFAFYRCSALTAINIPNSVTSIGLGAFALCSNLSSITMPNSVTSIGGSIFYECFGLTSVTISNSLTSISANAFTGCTNLTSINIPSAVTSIGGFAFERCYALTSVRVNWATPLAINANVFFNTNTANITLYVPVGKEADYDATAVWTDFGTIEACNSTVGDCQYAQNTLDHAGLTFTSRVASAFSLRKLSSTYTGSAIRVRRSSDNATQDIGFNANGDLDTSALTAFVGSNDGYVSIWYDQSGKNRHQIQTQNSKQPTIVSAGVIKTKSNKPTLFFDAADDGMTQTGAYPYLTAGAISVNLVASSNSGNGNGVLYPTDARRALQGDGKNWAIGPYQNTHAWIINGNFNHQSAPWSIYGTEVFTVVQPQTAANTSWRNGVTVSSGNVKGFPNKIAMGAIGSYSQPLRGFISEAIAFRVALSTTERAGLETNQLGYYPPVAVDMNLSTLEVSGSTLTPDFSATNYNYSVPAVSNATQSITITPTFPNLTRWAVKVNNGTYQDLSSGVAAPVFLNVGNNTVYVSHLAPDNTTVVTYAITVERSRVTANWTGQTNTDWNTASNWSTNAVPLNSEDVVIPGGLTNNPDIAAGVAAAAYSVSIEAGGELRLATGGSLAINGFSSQYNAGLAIYGNFVNAGTLHVGNQNAVAAEGIRLGGDYEYAYFSNTSTGIITIDHTANAGILSGISPLINDGTINIGSQASVGNYGINCTQNSGLTNNATGVINIDRASRGIEAILSNVTNAGKINIGSQASLGDSGVRATTIYNAATGEINVNRCAGGGIFSFAEITNEGKINIGALANLGGVGLYSGILNNSVGASIKIDRCGNNALQLAPYYNPNLGDAFPGNTNNQGEIIIGSIAGTGNNPITMSQHAVNNQGIIKVDQFSGTALSYGPDASFTNFGSLSIGSLVGGPVGISTDGGFTNEATGILAIDRTTANSIVSNNTFTNNGKMTMGASGSGNNSVVMNSNFSNNSCARFQLDQGNLSVYEATNTGLLQLANNIAITSGGTLTNDGVLKYKTLTNDGTLNNNNTASVIVTDSPNPINIFTLGSASYDGTLEGIYSDALATVPVGTFVAPNTFTPTGLGLGVYTFYAKISPANGSCTYIVPFTYSFNEGTHLDFDGQDDTVSIGNSLPVANASFTMEAWFQSLPGSAGRNRLITIGDTSAANYSAAGISMEDGLIEYFFYGDDGAYQTNVYGDANWHHVAFSFDNTTKIGKLYLDGVAVSEKTFEGDATLLSTTNQTRISGSTWASGEYFKGSVDEVRIWNTVRSSDEIFNKRDCEFQGNEAGLLAYYKFNQGIEQFNNVTVTSLEDATANANNGILNNFSLMGATSNWLVGHGLSQPTTTTVAAAACDTYTWSVNAITYTQSGTYVFEAPCHTEILDLTITPSTSNTATTTGCTSYTWAVNNQTYTASGTYTAINGCVTEQLVLTIAPLVTYYADADNDGFGNPAISMQLCAPIPGYVTIGTDCNDANPAVNPGATDVCYDGIDNDCNGVIDNVGQPGGCIPMVNSFTLGASCGAMVSNLAVTIVAPVVASATTYTFRVTNVATNASFVVNRPVNSFALSNYPGVLLGTQYQVQVSTNGGVTYGPACIIYTPAPAATIGAQCGTTLTSMGQFVYATYVATVTGYRFRVTNLSTNAVQEYDALGGQNRFTFNQLSAAIRAFGTTYTVAVALRNTDGTYLPFGAACTISTPAFPSSEIVLAQCDTQATSTTQTFNAVAVSGATEYRFQLVNSALSYSFSIDRPLNNFSLSMFPGLQPGTTYTVRVAVKLGGVWGPLTGKPCTIITPETAPEIQRNVVNANDFEAIVYPNPFAASFLFDVKTANESMIQVRVYDMLGKQVENSTVEAAEINNIQIGSNYPSGVYQVIVSQGAHTQTLRVIKR